tara:strand:- start:1510 stop:1710 length:201 start_codon:yes stop_codon:yes gene_type:complete
MKSLNGYEIEEFADDVFKILKEVPLFYVREVLELSLEQREREGEIEDLDTSSCSEEEEDSSSDDED